MYVHPLGAASVSVEVVRYLSTTDVRIPSLEILGVARAFGLVTVKPFQNF